MKQPFLAARVGFRRKLDWLLTTTVLLLISSVEGCTRHVNVSKEMTCECAPEHYMPRVSAEDGWESVTVRAVIKT